MSYQPIRFEEKFALFDEHWAPRVIAEMNDYQFKLVKLEGDFVWHRHDDTDEVFIVVAGEMEIGFRDGSVWSRRRDVRGSQGRGALPRARARVSRADRRAARRRQHRRRRRRAPRANDVWI